jgi:hypothetical protein
MSQRPSSTARALAVTALVGGFLLLFAVVVGSIGGEDETPDRRPASGKVRGGRAVEEKPAAYVVQNGDTLTSIARRTGVPVSRIEDLNPGVDPQILISGEKLKLR